MINFEMRIMVVHRRIQINSRYIEWSNRFKYIVVMDRRIIWYQHMKKMSTISDKYIE